ncbi:Calcipressin [Obba rivulosa]|uniref:Calcipressin n=1 Tax=Obba rivulosa TaxID=1052685 RepID=A0A8E2ATV7_9APHY|nr:Calcipressin [Obba rivulosa]
MSSSSPTCRSSPTLPELSDSESTPQRTNSLIVKIPPEFFHPAILDRLRDHFATYGTIYAWAPIKAFARVVLVYYLEDAAERAKHECDYLDIGPSENSSQTIMRIYNQEPFIIDQPLVDGVDTNFLRPPPLEKNFLISPPGSPPVGWEQTREDPPNATPLAEDLVRALRSLQLAQEREHHAGVEVLIEPEETGGIGIYVEDCDGGAGGRADEDWAYGDMSPARSKMRVVPTSMPPMAISV